MTTIDRLLEIMDRLRDPETGCPWDRKQDFSTIAPYIRSKKLTKSLTPSPRMTWMP